MSAICIMLFLLLSVSPSASQEFRDITKDYAVNMPHDFYYRDDYKVQWWYFTGHLFDERGREFGYELTFFVVGVQKRQYKSQFGTSNIYVSHFAISDVEGKKFHFTDRADSGAFGYSGARDDRLNVWVGNHTVEGTPERIHITASAEEIALNLILIPSKPLVLHGESGYSRKSEESPAHASIYFSYTHLKTEGSLHVAGKTFMVKGGSWFDRELSSKGLGKSQVGWDWFAVKLDDNRELMIYQIRKGDGTIDRYSSGTMVYPNGSTRHLTQDDFRVNVLDRYRSKKTKALYPARWEIIVPAEGIRLTVTPLIVDQEFIAAYTTLNYYWEGTCRVEGTARGRAYVEMTGY